MASPEDVIANLLKALGEGALQDYPAQPGQGAPLCGYALRVVASSGTPAVFGLRILRETSPKGKLGTKRDTGAITAASTTVQTMFKNDPNAVFWIVVNLGSVPVFVDFDKDPTTSSGIQIAPNGGVLICRGNDLRVYGPATARAAPGDRNATPILKVNNTSVGAATLAPITNWTYTVPAGRKATLEVVDLFLENRSTIPLNGIANVLINYAPGGAGTTNILTLFAEPGEASAFRTKSLAPQKTLVAGDVLSDNMQVTNGAAGTSVNLQSTACILEYDA